MQDTTIVAILLMLIITTVVIAVTIYQVRSDFYNRKRMFDIQIEMAQAQQVMTKDLPWEDLKKIINDIISFSVSRYIMNNSLNNIKNDELSLMWPMILSDLCPRIETSLSTEIKRQALKYISEDYFTRFIKNSVEIVIVYQLENNKENKINERLAAIQGKGRYRSEPNTKNNSK